MKEQEKVKIIKEKIFKLVTVYYDENFRDSSEFLPGKTKINYAGRVFMERFL